MPSKRIRNKGRSSGSNTPVPPSELPGSADETVSENTALADPATSANTDTTATAEPATTANTNVQEDVPSPQPEEPLPTPTDLILTSEKRRGVYECDYCHTDVSQVPRIRCAVIPDFDLCLECFIGTDHAATAARLQAAIDTQKALQDEGADVSSTSALVREAPTTTPFARGYRVCDSTRYPVFATAKHVATVKGTSDTKLSTATPPPSSAASTTSSTGKESDTNATAMEVDSSPAPKDALSTTLAKQDWNSASLEELATAVLVDDPKTVWTVEEDLRLLEGIRAHGLGNWLEIAEVVSGQGSTGKTPRRCMERYMDDFLGRYGHILPPFTVVMEDLEASEAPTSPTTSVKDGDLEEKPEASAAAQPPVVSVTEETPRASKRRTTGLLRSPSGVSSTQTAAGWTPHKRFKCVPTPSLPEFEKVWPKPYLPNDQVQVGAEVGRDSASKAEQTYVRLTAAAASAEEAERIRKDWEANRLLQPGGPTCLPPRLDDIMQLPGSELLGFMPRRGDFDIEWENDAEQAVADMEFLPGEPAEDRELKLQVLAIYNRKLDDREKRKNFIISRKLWDYRQAYQMEKPLPADERDLVHRMRLFERFHTPEEHSKFLVDILRAKRLRKEIAKLQMYRRLGIRTLADAERYEIDKQRRLTHRNLQREEKREETQNANGKSTGLAEETSSTSLWKQYRTGERKNRKSINRGSSGELTSEEKAPAKEVADVAGETPETHPSTLSSTEQELCEKLDLSEVQYKEIKKALISQSLKHGLLDRETLWSPKRSFVKMDVERRGQVLDFFLRAGWISSKASSALRQDSSGSTILP